MSPDTPPPPPFSNPSAFKPGAPQPTGPTKTSAAAMASLVLGILSLFCVCVTAIPGLICGFVGLSNIGRSNGQLKGRGPAILGIILSVVLSIVGVAGYMVYGGKQISSNPMLREIFGAGKAMMEGAAKGTEIAAALKAHAAAHDGKLPASLDELVAAGSLDASKLTSPLDGSPGFWKLEQPAGTVLADLPPKTIIVRGGPITVQDESLEIVITADGVVEPRDVVAPGTSIPEESSHGEEGATPESDPAAPETPTPAPSQQ